MKTCNEIINITSIKWVITKSFVQVLFDSLYLLPMNDGCALKVIPFLFSFLFSLINQCL